MKKIACCATVIAIVVLMSMSANAQEKMSVGAGVDIMIPVGSFGDSWGTGFGGTAEFDYAVRPNFSFTGKIGYLTWSAKNLPTGWTASYSGVPLLVGVKWYPRFIPQEGVRFYGHLELGIMAGSVSASGPAGRYVYVGKGSQTDFTIVPSVGIEIPAGPNGAVDISARYFDISRKGSIGFRAGYKLAI
ncbi:MAG TPA: outer membrane beta-barrel protein [Bacteroidota bacterium]